MTRDLWIVAGMAGVAIVALYMGLAVDQWRARRDFARCRRWGVRGHDGRRYR